METSIIRLLRLPEPADAQVLEMLFFLNLV